MDEEKKNMTDQQREDYEQQQENIDRTWYTLDEGGADIPDLFDQDDELEQFEKKQFSAKRQTQEMKSSYAAQLRNQREADQDRWVATQLINSGIVERTGYDDTDFVEEQAAKVHLQTHSIVPPFLEGKHHMLTKQFEPVIPIKDVGSDMAMVAKNGSVTVKRHRDNKEKKKSQKKEWNVAGTKFGNVMGIKEKDETVHETDDDIRNKNKFADHMKNASGASEFSQTKTIKEQRQYLPIFSVRDELLRIVDENPVVIIIGETGSGKTTQLAQYLYEAGYCRNGQRVACTQPRRVAEIVGIKFYKVYISGIFYGMFTSEN